jgi:hypothetical protein
MPANYQLSQNSKIKIGFYYNINHIVYIGIAAQIKLKWYVYFYPNINHVVKITPAVQITNCRTISVLNTPNSIQIHSLERYLDAEIMF